MDSFEHNRKSWNELTILHADSSFYDIDSFKKGKTSLNHIEIEELGDITGKKLLHLQCHFGMDTLSLARQGAAVVGVDISDTSIQTATELSDELEIPAKFIRSNVYDIKNVLNETFDIVYTSYGAINWLNDLDKWAKIISRYLKPNGIFYMVEFHPFIYTLNDNSEIVDSYFKSHPLETVVGKSYTDKSEISNKNMKHIEWHHSLSEVLNSLITNGLKIEFLNEFPYQVYDCFPTWWNMKKGSGCLINMEIRFLICILLKQRKFKTTVCTMCKINSQDDSKFKDYSLLYFCSMLKILSSEIGYYSYMNCWQT